MDISWNWHIKRIWIFFGLMVAAGCTGYHAKPLNNAGLAQKLTEADKNKIIHDAMQLHHARLPPIALDFSKPLNAQQLAVIAVLVNPDLKALRAKQGVSSAQVFDAGLLPDPQMTASYDDPLHQTNPPTIPFSTAFNFGLSWDIAGLITRPIKIKIAMARDAQVRYDVAWQEWQIANQAELLATRYYYLQQQLTIIRQAKLAATHLLDITKNNLQKHEIKIDEFGVRQNAYLDLQDQQLNLQRTLDKTKLQLKQVLGLAPTEEITIKLKPPVIPSAFNAESLFHQAIKSRLDLLALQAGYDSQEAQVYQAVLGQFPRFNVGISRARDTGDVNTFGELISFDLPIVNRNRGTIVIAQATREQLAQEYVARLHQTRAEIASLVADLQTIQHSQKILIHELPNMEKSKQLMYQGLLKGHITQITYEDIRVGLLNKKIKSISLKQDAAEQFIALQIAVGQSWHGDAINEH